MTLAGVYPPPEALPIVEPFAGGAGYSLAWRCPAVVLVERDPKVAAIWRWLTRTTEAEILALPDVPEGGTVDDLSVIQEARWLIGFNLNAAITSPVKRPSKWARESPQSYWGASTRAGIAQQLRYIRHWRVIEGDYREAERLVPGTATWFIDPPYHASGKHYKQHSTNPDWYVDLGRWSRERRGLVIACEQHPASWLPFQPIHRLSRGGQRGPNHCIEVSWINRMG